MEGQGAEIAGPEASPVVGDGKAHLLNGGNAPHFVIHRVRLPDVGQLGHPVQLRRGQGIGGRVHNQKPLPVLLDNGLAGHRVVFQILHHVGLGIGLFGGGHLRKGGDLHPGIGADAGIASDYAGASDIGDLLHWRPGGQPGGDLQGGGFPHAVGEDIRLGVKEDGTAHLVLPVIVVGEAAEGRLQPADDDGDISKNLPDPVGVDDGGAVRP